MKNTRIVSGGREVTNEELKEIYDSGILNWHSGFEESLMLISMLDTWQGLNVLEIGCGEGHLCNILSYAGANVTGIDYSEKQIDRARKKYPLWEHPNLYFMEYHFKDISIINGKLSLYMPEISVNLPDVVIMQGVIEHFDCPWDDLNWIMDNLLEPSGSCLLSVPNWVNPRGFIYHTLRLLFDAKMSLTDLHYFLPDDFETWNDNRYHIEMKSCDYSWAAGPEMIADLKDRIPKALPKDPYDYINIPGFLTYAERQARYTELGPLSGANLGVMIEKTNKERS